MGSAGEQGEAGWTGAQGSTSAGVVGPAGRTGPAGPQGSVGPSGETGPMALTDRWSSYREIWFPPNSMVLEQSEQIHVHEVADYSKRNRSVRIGLDGAIDRASTVHEALVQAGVPAWKIQTGAFGDQRLSQSRRVEVLVRNGN